MQFYKIKMTINTKDSEVANTPKQRGGRICEEQNWGKTISAVCERFNEKIIDKGYFFLSDVFNNECVYGLVLRDYLNYGGHNVKSLNLSIEELKKRIFYTRIRLFVF